MIKNYFTTAVRNLFKNRMYTAINISGFTIGLVCWIFILGYTNYEMSYDGFHPHKDRIYRIVRENKDNLNFESGASGALRSALLRDIPEIEEAVRLLKIRKTWLTSDNNGFYHDFCLTDSEFPNLFLMTFIAGDAKTSLSQPYGIIISQSTAHRFFGAEDPIGKTIQSGDRYSEGDYIVTGVFKDWPSNSTIQFDCLTATLSPKSIASWAWVEWKPNDSWHPTEHYVLLKENASPEKLEDKLQDVITTYMGDEASKKISYHLQPLSRIHLYSKQDYNFPGTGNISQIYILYTIGFFIITLICINFVNFATALSYQRAKEIGMRKVVGAQRMNLALQFLCEPLLLCLIALCIAWGLVIIAAFTLDIGVYLTSENIQITLLWSIALSFLSGICGGIYPAYLVSKFSISEIFHAKTKISKWHARKALATFQLMISIGIFISTIVVYQQLQLIQKKELGFDKEAVVVMPIFQLSKESRTSFTGKYVMVEQEFKKHPDIIDASASNSLPGLGSWSSKTVYQTTDQEQTVHRWRTLVVTQSFLDFYGVDILKGRNFTPEEGLDTAWTKRRKKGESIIINQSAAKKLGLENPIGQKLKHGQLESEIIGVVEDFHTASLRNKIEPIALKTLHGNLRNLSVRVRTENMPEAMAYIEKMWYKFMPHRPFEYFFLDDRIAQDYKEEKQLEDILNIAIAISIFITCMGMLGMVSLSVEYRQKEIGIRKVLGASTPNLVRLLSSDTVKHLLIANLIAWPAVYYVMQHWLQNFAYQVDLGLWPFIIAFALVTVIILVTISTQAIKAACKNPVETLRYE